MLPQKGKFIALYGINNLGKTTQAEILVKRIREIGLKAEYLKYPVYSLEPSGPIINAYLRERNPHGLSPREAQIFYALNRYHFEPRLIAKLEQGINIIAEDYRGTGIAWGKADGVDENFLKNINSRIYPEDLCFLFDGDRFIDSVESGHYHENEDDLIARCRRIHMNLATEFGWRIINANLSIKEVHEKLWTLVRPVINQ